jgi:hypothetical protein
LEANPKLGEQLSYGPGPNGWENGTIGGFLSGMRRWATDADQSKQYDVPPDWGYFAFLLFAGKEYE